MAGPKAGVLYTKNSNINATFLGREIRKSASVKTENFGKNAPPFFLIFL